MSLKVWLPLDGDLRNNGTLNVAIINNGATINTNGKIGQCYQFDNNSSYIDLNHSELYNILNGSTQPFSICFWVYHADTSRAIIFGDFSVTGGKNFNIELTTGHALRWYWGTPDIRISAMNVGLNTWTHITFTYSGTVLKGYLNGIEKYTNTVTLAEKNRTTGSYYLGRDGRTGTTTLNGKLNDFRIYDHCLSAAEVHEVAQGLILHYKLDGFNSNLIWNSNWQQGSQNWSGWGTPPTREIVQIDGKNWLHVISNTSKFQGYSQNWNNRNNSDNITQNTQVTVSYTAFSNTSATFRNIGFHWNDENGNIISQSWFSSTLTTTPTRYSFTATTPSNCVKFNIMVGDAEDTAHEIWITDIKLEVGSAATIWTPNENDPLGKIFSIDNNIVQDSSGYGHNGTALNTVTISSDTPRYNNSTSLVADNSAINCGRGGMVTDSITVNFWLKSSSCGIPVSCTEGGGWNFEASGDYFRFPVYISGVGYKYYASTVKQTDLCNNQWHMLTGIYDRLNGHIKIYVDGELNTDFNAETTNVIGYNSTNVIWLGAEASGSATAFAHKGMKGLFSDFRIYCTPLLDTDIKLLYNMGSRIDNLGGVHGFEFNEKAIKASLNKINYPTSHGVSYVYDEVTNTYTLTCGDRGSSSAQYFYYPEYNRSKTNYDIEIGWGQCYIHTAEFYSSKAITAYIDYNNNAINTHELSGNDNDNNRLSAAVTLPANTWTRAVFGYSNLNETKNPNHLTLYDFSVIYTASHTDTFTVKVRNIHTYVIDADSNHLQIAREAISHDQFIEDSAHDYASISNKSNALHATEFIEI